MEFRKFAQAMIQVPCQIVKTGQDHLQAAGFELLAASLLQVRP